MNNLHRLINLYKALGYLESCGATMLADFVRSEINEHVKIMIKNGEL